MRIVWDRYRINQKNLNIFVRTIFWLIYIKCSITTQYMFFIYEYFCALILIHGHIANYCKIKNINWIRQAKQLSTNCETLIFTQYGIASRRRRRRRWWWWWNCGASKKCGSIEASFLCVYSYLCIIGSSLFAASESRIIIHWWWWWCVVVFEFNRVVAFGATIPIYLLLLLVVWWRSLRVLR